MKKYLQYDSVDFAQEQSFVRWVRKTNVQDESFWEDWTKNHPEKKEIITDAVNLVSQLNFKEDMITNGLENNVWSRIEKDVNTTSPTLQVSSSETVSGKTGKLIRLFSITAVAAIALFLLIVNVGGEYDTVIKTQYAEMQSVILPDGSEIQINADSKISYNQKNWENSRKIELVGEAFFKVKKGAKFVVYTNNGQVEVLGTSFNIYSRAHSFDVYCSTGKVAVTANNKTSVLIPNQSVSVINKDHTLQNNINPNENRSNWKDGIFTYKSTSIGDVVQELERQLDIKISISENNKKRKYTGSFNISNVESALSEVFWPLKLEFDINGNQVVIHE